MKRKRAAALALALCMAALPIFGESGVVRAEENESAAAGTEKAEIVVDNSDEKSVSLGGEWKRSSGRSGRYGADYMVGTGGGAESTWFEWEINAPVSGEYTVSFWVPDSDAGVHDINSNAVYTVSQEDEILDTVTVDQRGKGGRWNELGTYEFTADENYSLRVCADGSRNDVNTMADAVKFEYTLPEGQTDIVTCDNDQAEIQGDWSASQYRKGYYGENYLTAEAGSTDASVTYKPDIAEPGNYAVYISLPAGDEDLSAEAPYSISHSGGISAAKIDQQGDNRGWLPVGIYHFDADGNAAVTVKGAQNGYVIADAVRFIRADVEVDSKEIDGSQWTVQEDSEAVGGSYLKTETDETLSVQTTVNEDGYYVIRYYIPGDGMELSGDAVLTVNGSEYQMHPADMGKGYHNVSCVYLEKGEPVDITLKNSSAGALVFDALRLEHTGYNALYNSFDEESGLEGWTVNGSCTVSDGSLHLSEGEILTDPEGCMNLSVESVLIPETLEENAKFGLILSGSNNSYLKIYADASTGRLILFDEQADSILAESEKTVSLVQNVPLKFQTVFSYPGVTVYVDGEEYLSAEYSRSGSVGLFAENCSVAAEFIGGYKRNQTVSGSGQYELELDQPAQTIWGLGIEVQSDSIGSGNNGLPESQVRSVPYGLEESERERLYTEMLRGFRYLRMAGGLYYRGTDEEGKHLEERWDTQNEELAELIEMSGIEGVDFEFWSPTPYFKASGSYIHGEGGYDGLRCYSPDFANDPVYKGDKQRFLEDFADTIVADLKMLEENGIPVVQFGLQNEAPHWVRSYSHCSYSDEEYYETMKVVVPKLREAFPDIHIHADSWNGQYSGGSQKIIQDEELLNEIDGWTFHRIGYDSNDQINNADYYNGNKGRDDILVYNNEFEYFSDTSDWKCINTAQSLMNWMTFENSPTWHWLHMLKPFGNSEASGYSLGYFHPYDYDTETEEVPEGFEDVEPGHWDYNYQNWNSIRGFLKYMPWNSIRYEVAEDEVRSDNRIMSYQTPKGNQVIVLTNRSESDLFTFNIDTNLDDTWHGYRYTPQSENEISLGTLSGEEISPVLPPLSIEFWVQEGTRPVPDRGVVLDAAEMELGVGETGQLNAEIQEEEPAIPGLTWSSSNEAVAKVDQNGLVQGAAEGQAVITVTRKDGGFSASCQVTVNGETEPETADKTALGLVISMAEKLEAEQSETSCYTEETWAAVQTALDAARTLAADEKASQEDVDNAFLELITAVNLLENAVQRVALQTAIEGAEAFLAEEETLEDYTPESVENLRKVLAEAQKIYAEESTDQETVNAAARRLMDAVTSLVVIDKDTRLDILIQKAEELLADAGQYTAASVENLQAALDEARLTADDRDASGEQINAAYSALAEAMTSMVRKADKSELQTALDKAAEILADTSKYVEESVAGLQAEADAAQAVYDREDADASEVGAAVKSLVDEILKARLMGDVDGDGVVDSADSAEVLEAAAEAQTLDGMQRLAADVNGDGAADSIDAAEILSYAAEQKDAF